MRARSELTTDPDSSKLEPIRVATERHSTKTRRQAPPTRLTQNRKRALTGGTFILSPKDSVRLQNMCSVCGNEIRNGIGQCWFCAVKVSTQRLTRVASEGRVVSHTAKAKAKRSKTQLANHATLQEWSASDQPSWLTAKFYAEKMQPLVADLSSSAIVRHLAVSRGYAAEIRRGRVPHPRHWLALARLLGLSE
jgi:hypothetical protein